MAVAGRSEAKVIIGQGIKQTVAAAQSIIRITPDPSDSIVSVLIIRTGIVHIQIHY